jgi:predicted nuclease of predicted toxin-antitoxin system
MKLLFDQNLSFKLCRQLNDLFPESQHVRLGGLDRADDAAIWRYAADNGFAFVTLDADFAEMAALHGPPPKVIWLRCGNQTTATVESLLRKHVETIHTFEHDAAACLEIY